MTHLSSLLLFFTSSQDMLSQTIESDDLVIKMAPVLDDQLYKMAPSFATYASRNTIELRVRLLAMNIGKSIEQNKNRPTRKEHHEDCEESRSPYVKKEAECRSPPDTPVRYYTTSTTTSTFDSVTTSTAEEMDDHIGRSERYAHDRCNELCKMIGIDAYNELVAVTQNILNIRSELCACTPQSCSVCFSETMTEDIKNIFLRTPLVNAFKRVGASGSTTIDMDRVRNIHWECLINEAKENLRKYETNK